jgi:polygalacturonase
MWMSHDGALAKRCSRRGRAGRRLPAALISCAIIFLGSLASYGRAAAHPAAQLRVPITEFGAVPDGKTLNTSAIQAAIDHAGAIGGATVVIPRGVFLTGALFLKPGVDILLEKDAVLKGSSRTTDYPVKLTRIEGHFERWLTALLNADGAHHLRVTGEGTIDGSGKTFWRTFLDRRHQNPDVTNLEVARPRLIFIQNSSDVLVSGIALRDAGFWNVHLYHCCDVVLERLNITTPSRGRSGRAPSSDGIDIDSSQRVGVRGCVFSVDDDCIALKGTKGPFALRDTGSSPVERILVEGCTFEAGHGALTVGSEATVVRHVVMENCTIRGRMPVLRMKLRPDTPQDYEDIICRDLTLDGTGSLAAIAPWMQFFDLKGQPPPSSRVSDITFSDIKGSFGSLGSIRGHDKTLIAGILFEDIDLKLKNARLDHGPVESLVFRNVVINGRTFQGR